MAAGDRKIKITETLIQRANPVTYTAFWQLVIENKVGEDVYTRSGRTTGSFGSAATWRAMTGTQMETQVNTDCAADANVPARDSLS